MEDGLRLFIRRIPSSFVLAVLIAFVTPDLSGQGDGVSCFSRINISINSGVPTRLQISQLTPRPISPGDTVILADRTELLFTCDDVGQIITAILMDEDGEMCSVDIHVEDKSPIAITCRDTLVSCLDNTMSISTEALIDVVSSCDDLTGALISHFDSDPVPHTPGSDTLQSVLRNHVVISASGDTARCTSQIFIERFDLGSIVFPSDITISCGSDPADTSVTGGINVDLDILGELCNIAVSAGDISKREKGTCQNPIVYERIWAAMDWTSNEIRTSTQLISVVDDNIYEIQAPMTLEMIPQGCEIGLVLDTAVIETICLDFTQDDIEIVLDGAVHEVADTVPVEPGTFSVIYRARSGCDNIIADTIDVMVTDDMLSAPILDCSSIGPKCILLRDGMPTLVGIDTLCRDAIFESCGNAELRARKVDVTCMSDSEEFVDILEFCPDELRSGQDPSTIMLEVVAIQGENLISNICVIEVEVKEDVPPNLVVVEDPSIVLGSDGTFTLDTSVLISTLTDNSDCILSLAMTGSGTGFVNTMTSPTGSGTEFAGALALTGSGFPFFADGDFYTFTCPDTGTYDVIIVAEDCDNNLALDTTSLTVFPGDSCDDEDMTGMIAGSILSGDESPLANVAVNLTSNSSSLSTWSSEEGLFQFGDLSESGVLKLHHNDSWLRGISVIDLKILQNYILGLIDLEEWQKAAADIDRSGRITSKDLLLAKLILLDRQEPGRSDDMPWLFSVARESYTYEEYLEVPAEISDHISITAAKKGDINGDAISNAKSRSQKNLPMYIQRIDDNHTSYTIDMKGDIFQVSIDVSGGRVASSSHQDEYVYFSDRQLDVIKYESDKDQISFVIEHERNTQVNLNLGKRLEAIAYSISGDRSDLSITTYPNSLLSDDESLILHAYPNPSNGDVWLELSLTDQNKRSDIGISVTNMQGQLIDQREWIGVMAADIFPYKLPNLPYSGMYIAHVRMNNRTESLHIIKN